MLEVMDVLLKSVEVKRDKYDVPANVTVNVRVESIERRELDVVILHFTYAVDYTPDVARIRMVGAAICSDTPENIDRIVDSFGKKKELPPDLGGVAINIINANMGMNSVFFLRPFDLLPHFMPPPLITEESLQEAVNRAAKMREKPVKKHKVKRVKMKKPKKKKK